MIKVKMTYTCEIARTPMEHGECHASTCQCPCHNGLGGICDCAEKRAIEEAKNFKVEKAQWLKIIEPELREQIAREILAKCKNEKETNTSEFGSYEVSGCLEFIQLEDTAYYEVTCTHAEDAAIAGGNKE